MIGLSRSSFYYRQHTSAQVLSDQALRDQIEMIHQQLPGYGYRRIDRQLRRSGIVVNRKRIRRVTRQFGLYAVAWKRFVRTTDSNHDRTGYPNLVKDLRVDHLNQVWVADIT
jgi:putative transposase